MATLEILSSNCKTQGCEARATVRIVGGDGKPVGEYCSRHGNQILRETAKAEGARGRS
jgi:hypothetical protein